MFTKKESIVLARYERWKDIIYPHLENSSDTKIKIDSPNVPGVDYGSACSGCGSCSCDTSCSF